MSPEEAQERDRKVEAEEKDRKIKEYESVIGLMRDTGESIWVINGAYLVALTILVGGFASVLLDKDTNYLRLVSALLGLSGALYVAFLWWASFKRNYAFYVLRIQHARTLERTIGFSLLRLGEQLSDPNCGTVQVGDNKPIVIPLRARKSIEQYTERLILTFGAILLGLMAVGIYRLGTLKKSGDIQGVHRAELLAIPPRVCVFIR
jgi:hypothetical protein